MKRSELKLLVADAREAIPYVVLIGSFLIALVFVVYDGCFDTPVDIDLSNTTQTIEYIEGRYLPVIPIFDGGENHGE